MNLIDRIRDNFYNGFFGKAMYISELPSSYPAWTINERDWYGVVVPIESAEIFNEQFANVRLFTQSDVSINGTVYNVLMLISTDIELKSEFATVCSQFVEPGDNGEKREELMTNPQNWWERWKNLLGNTISYNEPYSVLGELITIEYYLKKGYLPKWTGADYATHDIELDNFSCEVKSTIERYDKEVTISSVYQLRKTNERLELVFCRFERSLLGRNIDELVNDLVNIGYSRADLEKNLEKHDLVEGCVARKTKYKLIEMKKYLVDDNFPTITEMSFKNNTLPANVIRFTYTINLSGIEGENLL